MGKAFNTLIGVIHTHSNTTSTFIMINFHFLFWAIISFENDLEFSWLIDYKICSFILITKGMTSNDDRFFPPWNKSWDVFNNDRLSENSTIQNISDGTIGAFPHLLKVEFFDPCFIWSNGSTFNSNLTLLNRISSINSNLIICSISMFDS